MRNITRDDINKDKQDYVKGDILVMSIDWLHGKYKEGKYQLYVCNGSGFGCSSTTVGRAIFGQFLYDFESVRIDRGGDVLGVLSYDTLKELTQDKDNAWIKENYEKIMKEE